MQQMQQKLDTEYYKQIDKIRGALNNKLICENFVLFYELLIFEKIV